MRAISLAPLTVPELSPPEQVSCARAAGYSHVDLRVIQATPGNTAIRPGSEVFRETRRRLAAEGIEVLDIEVVALDADLVVGDCEPGLEAAALLGGKHLVAVGGDPDEHRLTQTFGKLCELAGRFGLTVDLEFIPYRTTNSIAAARRLIEGSGAGNGGILIDSLHFNRAGETLETIAGLPDAWLHCLQLCDAPAARPADDGALMAEARQERLFPGEGGLDLLALMRAMPALPISIEIPTTAMARTVGPLERARRALAATQDLLSKL